MVRPVTLEVGHAHRVRSQLTRAISERCVVGRDHPAFAGRDDLPRVEAEHGLVRVGADLAALVLGADRRGGVLYDVEAVTLRDLVDRADIAGEADLVDRHDGLRSPRDLALDVRRVDVEGAGAMFGEPTGPPVYRIAVAGAVNGDDGTMTSSPGPAPDAGRR